MADPRDDTPKIQEGLDLASRSRLAAAFDTWRRRLLDLTKRNRALNYRPQRVATVTIVDERPAEVYRQLVQDEVTFSFTPTLDVEPVSTPPEEEGTKREESEPEEAPGTPQPFSPYERDALLAQHLDTVLQCRATTENLDKSLRRIADIQRSSLDEQGVNTIYLALGFLHYKEPGQQQTALKAPLVLVPVTLQRAGAAKGYTLSLGDDEPVANPTLTEYLRRFFLIHLPPLPEPTETTSSVDLQAYFLEVQRLIAPQPGWKVTEEMALSPFAFSKLVMYKDLENSEEDFANHRMTQRLVLRSDGDVSIGLPADVETMTLDTDYPPERTATVVDADSTQLRAIAAVERKHDLVIHGPPGTGKSQTITNLIAQGLAARKSVLFVAEKTAALDVVARRLRDVGLSEFCLELHATKANKQQVVQSISGALNAINAVAGSAPCLGDNLRHVRENLNGYVEALHEKRTPLGYSVYQAVGEFAATQSAPRLPFPSDPTALPRDQYTELLLRLKQVDAAGANVGEVATHGWRASRLDQLSEDARDQIVDSAQQLHRLGSEFDTQAATLAHEFGLPVAQYLKEVESLTDDADLLARSPGWPADLLFPSDSAALITGMRELITHGRGISAIGSRMQSRYRVQDWEEIHQDDARYVEEQASGLLGWVRLLLDGRLRSIRRRWLAFRQSAFKGSLLDQAADFKNIPRWLQARRGLAERADAAHWFGRAWEGPDSDWRALEGRVSWLMDFFELAGRRQLGPKAYEAAGEGQAMSSTAGNLRKTTQSLESGLPALIALIRWPKGYLLELTIPNLQARLGELLTQADRGPTWAAFVSAVMRLQDTSARPFGEAALSGEIPATQVGHAFRRALFGRWLELVLPREPALASFGTAGQETLRREFQALDEGILKEHQARVAEDLRTHAQSRYASAASSHRSFLQREMAKQKRYRPLRVTLREAYSAIRAIKPCFMMSPLSVAQFLPSTAQFDLVIFDEASQLPTEDAVGAFCRGQQLVVVGDPKQLPPTNFFTVQTGAVASDKDESGEPIIEETESVLEECIGAGLHQAYLEWHYRSAHEHLIEFSNKMFYQDRLVVFPAAIYDGPEFGVRFEHLPDARYVGAGLNPVEAETVAKAVIKHFQDHPEESLGVGTFNSRQQNAIWDELERIRRTDPSLEQYFAPDAHEPFFVKNLENIQGDERDVIFLSVTYGRRDDGRILYNFGPLNRDNGWRRLNVLVSRARKRMRVFSSLRAADLDPNATSTQGPRLLREFLHFAETGRLQRTQLSVGEAESLFEAEVADLLQQSGYLVDAQVGVGKYRIDLGVRHPDHPGAYIAGIECDGAAYHSAPCARDRDRLRQQVLERRGWTICRVWSTDWFKDRVGTTKRLLSTLRALSEGVSLLSRDTTS